MNMKALVSTVLVAVAVLGSSNAMAYSDQHSNRNIINLGALEARIDSGVATGKLTRGEERVLRSELKNLRSTLKTALKDHRITHKEQVSLDYKESKLKKNIYKLSNNRVMAAYGHSTHHRLGGFERNNNQPVARIIGVSTNSSGYVHVK